MANNAIVDSADRDLDARAAIWKTICVAADNVRHRFSINAIQELDGREIRIGSDIPRVASWQLVEALSLLCVILRSEEATAQIVHVFGKTGPVKLREDGTARYLWAQQTLKGTHSDLKGRPDLIVTSSDEQPHPGNALRIIEAKCMKQLGTQTIRAEFGKAYDLRVTTYFIWSYYSPTPSAVMGAKGLGIDLQALGFDTERRPDLISSPEALISFVAQTQDIARRSSRFARALEGAEQDAQRKLLGPSR